MRTLISVILILLSVGGYSQEYFSYQVISRDYNTTNYHKHLYKDKLLACRFINEELVEVIVNIDTVQYYITCSDPERPLQVYVKEQYYDILFESWNPQEVYNYLVAIKHDSVDIYLKSINY